MYKLSNFFQSPATVFSLTTSLKTQLKETTKLNRGLFLQVPQFSPFIQNLHQPLLSQQSKHLDAPKTVTVLTIKFFYFKFCNSHPAKLKNPNSNTNLL
jgi:hypothetical protein